MTIYQLRQMICLKECFVHISKGFLVSIFSTRRTKVIDDESDYYATESKWLSKTEREQLQKKKDALHARMHASRKDRKITFDFAGRSDCRLPSTVSYSYHKAVSNIPGWEGGWIAQSKVLRAIIHSFRCLNYTQV